MQAPRVKEATQIQGMFLLFGFAIAAFFPFLALYLEQHHGLDASQIGVVIAFSAAARMIANPLWGHYADTRLGRLTVLQVCLIGAAAAGLALNVEWALRGGRRRRDRALGLPGRAGVERRRARRSRTSATSGCRSTGGSAAGRA